MFVKALKILFVTIICTVYFGNNHIYAAEEQINVKAPHKWKIIYVESGGYIDYANIFAATVKSLAKLGLIENANFPPVQHASDVEKVWDWLSENAGGNYIEFVKDGFYSAIWNDEERIKNKQKILQRIKEKNDVDMILAFGTSAGLDYATDEHNIPTLSMSVTDAVQSGIINSIEDSGLDHVHGQVEVGRYERQLSIFYDIFKFKKLGVPVPDTETGRATVAMPSIEKMAKNLNFDLVVCNLSMFGTSDEQFNELKLCIEDISKKSDAIYLTTTAGMQWDKMQELLDPIIQAGIPSFSQSGLIETKLGVLMSIAQSSFDNEGMHGAKTIAQIIGGAKPRSLSQVFEGPLGLSINLKMAMLIGWNPSFEILAAVDNIYKEIFNYNEIEE